MNRCLASSPSRAPARLAATVLCLALHGAALAQQVMNRPFPIPTDAQRATLVVTNPPDILLNDQPTRLSPGARIRGQDNLLKSPAALVGQPLVVRYKRDPVGLVHEVWVLTDAESQASAPAY